MLSKFEKHQWVIDVDFLRTCGVTANLHWEPPKKECRNPGVHQNVKGAQGTKTLKTLPQGLNSAKHFEKCCVG